MPDNARTLMHDLASDLKLVESALAALDHIPKAQRSHTGEDGLTVKEDWGFIAYEHAHSELLIEMDQRTLSSSRLDLLSPLPGEEGPVASPSELARIRSRLEDRERRNPWFVLPRNAERLDRLLVHHVEGAVTGPPHIGFTGPRAGHDYLADRRPPSTAVDWLLFCPQRCLMCLSACRRDLQQLRRALEKEIDQVRRDNPAVYWKIISGEGASLRIEVWDGSRRATLKLLQAELFKIVADRMPQSLTYREYIQYRMDESATRLRSKSARSKQEAPTPRVALREDSVQKMARDVRKSLKGLSDFWKVGPVEVAWEPPTGSRLHEASPD